MENLHEDIQSIIARITEADGCYLTIITPDNQVINTSDAISSKTNNTSGLYFIISGDQVVFESAEAQNIMAFLRGHYAALTVSPEKYTVTAIVKRLQHS